MLASQPQKHLAPLHVIDAPHGTRKITKETVECISTVYPFEQSGCDSKCQSNVM